MHSIQEDAMPDDVHRIEFRAKSIEDLRSYLKGTAVDLGCRPVVRKVGDEYVVEGYAPLAAVEQARTARSGSPVSGRVDARPERRLGLVKGCRPCRSLRTPI